MEILSFGTELRKGEYKIHSRFSSAVNFVYEDSFAFVVNESIGTGPINIVVKGIVPQAIDFLEIDDTCIKINGIEFICESDKRYDSSIDLSKYDYDLFFRNLEIIENIIVEKAPQQSLSFLLENKRMPSLRKGLEGSQTFPYNGKNKFEEECRRIIGSGVEQVLYGDLIAGVKMIKGLGPGLTPSGDDFNSGLLIALNVAKQIKEWIPAPTGRGRLFAGMTDVELGLTIKNVYNAAKGKNLFTNSFLGCAANGDLFYKFRELLNALVHSDVNEIINNTELVLTMGETSGADQLTGFLIGMKRFLI